MNKQKIAIILSVLFFILIIFVFWFLFSKPENFPVGSLIRVEDGSTLSRIGEHLEEKNIVKSNTLFVVLAKITGKEDDMKSGDYFFEEPLSVFGLIKRLIRADFGLDPLKVRVLEGETLKDIAESFSNFENFSKEKFLEKTDGLEGYLFPDTYFFLPNADTEIIIKTMQENFDKKAGAIDYDVLIMASLIEKEVADYDDRRIVSGILWKRLDVGMPLQVDAVFPYIKGENSGRVLFEDLKIDSPYNTYLYKGLPPTPISNPGLDAIDAARNPQESPYWFYLSDSEGITHFAKTFEEHKINKAKYLR